MSDMSSSIGPLWLLQSQQSISSSIEESPHLNKSVEMVPECHMAARTAHHSHTIVSPLDFISLVKMLEIPNLSHRKRFLMDGGDKVLSMLPQKNCSKCSLGGFGSLFS